MSIIFNKKINIINKNYEIQSYIDDCLIINISTNKQLNDIKIPDNYCSGYTFMVKNSINSLYDVTITSKYLLEPIKIKPNHMCTFLKVNSDYKYRNPEIVYVLDNYSVKLANRLIYKIVEIV